MKILCIEPVLMTKYCSYTLFENNKLVQCSTRYCEEYDTTEEYEYVCYDLFKVFDFRKFEQQIKDVKTLYELKGVKSESLSDLAKKILGEDEINNFCSISRQVGAHLKSYKQANVSTSAHSLTKLVPRELIKKLYEERAILMHKLYLSVAPAGVFYNTFYSTMKALHVIQQTPLRINLRCLDTEKNSYVDALRTNCKDGSVHLRFDPIAAKTGRISFSKGTFNLYTFPKIHRQCILPISDEFKIVQFDYKSFQPRLAIFYTEDEQFKNRFKDIDDVYSIFPGNRDEVKISFLSWMFSDRSCEMFDSHASPIKDIRRKLTAEVQTQGRIRNAFYRDLNFPKDTPGHVVYQNFITSLEADAMLKLVAKLFSLLEKSKSKIAFPYHDSIVMYVHHEEMHLITAIKNCMEKFLLGWGFDSIFPVSVKIGDNFGDMEKYTDMEKLK